MSGTTLRNFITIMAALRLVHRCRRQIRRERVFRDRTNPLDVYDDIELFDRFRFPRNGLTVIFDEFCHQLDYLSTRKGSLPATMQIMIALRFFATGSFQLVIADLFGISKGTVHNCLKRVSNVIANSIGQHVRFGSQDEMNKQKTKFYAMAGFPNIIGCIDCTHIRIIAPSLNEHEYVNRKGFHSLNVQLVCNADLIIMNCVVKWPGAVHDARILRESLMYAQFEAVPSPLDGYILGDGGYMLRNWLLTPYLNPVTRAHQDYNNAHCRTRSAIERCNGVLKRRWHCLHGELRYAPGKACKIIQACIALHNIATNQRLPLPAIDEVCNCIDQNDDNRGEAEDDDMDDEEQLRQNIDGRIVRDRIAQEYF